MTPPDIDLWKYERTGEQVDYILTWCENRVEEKNRHKKSFMIQMNKLYKLQFENEDGRVKLYKHI